MKETDEGQFACLAAMEMIERIGTLRKEVTELLGVRVIPTECDVRIGIATGEALVGSIGSEIMMNYTVMGDTVNLAARLEAANKLYGSRSLIAAATVAKIDETIQFREIDRLTVVGQTQPQAVFELLGRKGEPDAKTGFIANTVCRRARGVSGAAMGGSARRTPCGTGSGSDRRSVDGAPEPHRSAAGTSAGRRLGRRMAP